MVISARARSVSTSYASFEAELEGAILQHTGAVDYYLETQAPKWSANHTDEHATPQTLHSVFIGDMNTSFWQAFAHRGEISLFDDSRYQICGGWPVTSAQDAYKAAHLLHNGSKRRPRVNPLQGESRLEQYLQQDLQRYMDMREELESEASGSHAAVLSVPLEQQVYAHTSGNSSFVRLPDLEQDADNEADDAATAAPLATAVAVATAAAMAAVNDVFAPEGDGAVMPMAASVAASTASRVSWDSSTAAATTTAAVAAAQLQQEQQVAAADMSTSSAAAVCTVGPSTAAAGSHVTAPEAKSAVPFAMEDDEAIAAQKLAARAKLAELEGETSSTVAEVAPSGKLAGKGFTEEDDSTHGPGSVHSSLVPQRPRGLTGVVRSKASAADAYGMGLLGGKADSLGYGPVSAQEARTFLHFMMTGLVLCMVLMPALWGLQAWTGAGTPAVHTGVSSKLQGYGNYVYVMLAAAILLYVFKSALTLSPPLLHFYNPELEERYLMWSNAGKLFVDSMFQVLFLVVGGCLWMRLKHTGASGEDQATAHARILLSVVSMMGAGLPMVVLLLVRSVNYAKWREQLLAGSRVCSIMALFIMQLSLPSACLTQLPPSVPFVALAQLMGIACMQVRLATFVPCQVLHLLVLLLRTQAQNPMLQLVQLFGGGLCLPCLLLHSMEVYSRKAFLANVAKLGGKQKVV